MNTLLIILIGVAALGLFAGALCFRSLLSMSDKEIEAELRKAGVPVDQIKRGGMR
jgi:hypothetical protein